MAPQQFRNGGLVRVTPEEECPENMALRDASGEMTEERHFPRGVKGLESREEGGNLRDSGR